MHELENGAAASAPAAEPMAAAHSLSDEDSDSLAASIEALASRMEQLASQLKAH